MEHSPDRRSEIKTEIIRKLIHFLVALSPFMASLSRIFTLAFLLTGTACYAVFEILRLKGINIPLVSVLTNMSSRPRDRGHFIWSPVTLGMGAFFSFLIFPHLTAAIAVYAMAFGDGLAGLVGKLFGRLKPRFLFGKSVEGSLACCAAVLLCSWLLTSDLKISLIAAITAMLTEALPLGDFDNLALPLVVGTVMYIVM